MGSRLLMNRGISVIICCYNSAWVIRRTLEALKEQRFKSPVPYEIVLVDNKCTDNTVEVAEDAMKDCKVNFHIVKEDTPGLANARRKGIKEVNYEYVLYCDDDNLLCPSYVSTMVKLLDSMPDVGAIGGKGIAEFETEPAEIVKENLGAYAVGSQTEHENWLWGAGLTLRTALVRDVYDNQKCYLMGRKGKELLSGDDTELVMSMILRGYKVFATDDVYYTHVLKAERLTEEYFYRLNEGLTLPLPVFEIMRAVIYGHKFYNTIQGYLELYKRHIKYHILWWKPNAKIKSQNALNELSSFRKWGLFQLYSIYCQWNKIKRQTAQKKRSACHFPNHTS